MSSIQLPELPADKPTWQSTEFLLTLASTVLTIGVFTGWIKPEDTDTLKTSLQEIIQSGIVVIGNALVLWKYIQSRTEVKKEREALKRELLVQHLRMNSTIKG